jgi:hypothetical protein
MNEKYMCYCGLYCENCVIKVKIEPAAKVLYCEMKKANFENVMDMIPDGKIFWSFLKSMAEDGACAPCKEGGGNPSCAIRVCAEEKAVEMCAFCESYPCDEITQFFEVHPILKDDNTILREEGMEAWSKLQDERKKKGFTYADEK